MKTMVRSALFVAAAFLSVPSLAAGYSALYVFGDSLSDRGNLASALESPFSNPPSYNYSFTNGPVAVSILASGLGLKADPSLWLTGFADTSNLFPVGYVPGTSYAVADATAQMAGGLNVINLPYQIDAFIDHAGAADPDALYTVFIGGNDVANATRANNADTALENAVSSEMAAIEKLMAAGARNFLVVNVPDVGGTPAFATGDPTLALAATANANRFNSLLMEAIDGIDQTNGITIHQFDLFSLNKSILDNAQTYGITDTTSFCYDIALPTDNPADAKTTEACGPNAENIDKLAFWNNFHPTAKVHKLIGEAMLAELGVTSSVPEPETWAMLILGFALTGGLMRMNRRRTGICHATQI